MFFVSVTKFNIYVVCVACMHMHGGPHKVLCHTMVTHACVPRLMSTFSLPYFTCMGPTARFDKCRHDGDSSPQSHMHTIMPMSPLVSFNLVLVA